MDPRSGAEFTLRTDTGHPRQKKLEQRQGDWGQLQDRVRVDIWGWRDEADK
jgi:hypothetical protein